MIGKAYTFQARVWLYPGNAAWHFISLPKKEAEEIKAIQANKPRRGWGAVYADVTIGKTTWRTSIFPDKKSGTYLLPLKAKIRKQEGIFNGDSVEVKLLVK